MAKQKEIVGDFILDNERVRVYHQTGQDDHYRIEVKAPYQANGAHERYYIKLADDRHYEESSLRKILEVMSR